MKRKFNLTFLMTIVMMMLFPLTMAAEESTEPTTSVGYVVFNSADGTLTFKYGEKPTAGTNETVYDLNEGTNAPGWNSKASSITKVVFDKSFQNARPTSCYQWFYNCYNASFTNIENIKYLNTSEVTNMNRMFNNCSGLTSLDLTSFNTENVTDMNRMFYGCSGLTSLDLSSFNTSNVTNMDSMFAYCPGLTTIYVSDNFKTDKVQSSTDMFKGCTSLVGAIACDGISNIDKTYANATSGYFCGPYPAAGVGVAYALYNNGTLTFRYGSKKPEVALDLNEGTNSPGWLSNASSITKVVFDKSFQNARPTSCYKWFYKCNNASFTNIEDIKYLNTSEVTNMNRMFYSCSKLTSLDVTGFNTEKVTDMGLMFRGCSELTSLTVTNFNTKKVTDMHQMFFECSGLTSLDVTGFNTENVTDISSMFYGCLRLTSLDLSSFNTEKVTNMNRMFYSCSKLTSLDVTGFNTEKVTDMSNMFAGCSGLTTIYVSDKFTTDNVEMSSSVFYGCSKLEGANKCDGSIINNTDKNYANYVTGYFKTYYKVNGTQTDLCGSGEYNSDVNGYGISSLNFTDGDIVTNVPLYVYEGISYTRIMTNEWGTLCLPFDVKYKSNESYKLYSLTSATTEALTFTEWAYGSAILAGTPMAIKRISETADNKVTITTPNGTVNTSLNNPTTESEWRLVGTYRTADVPDEGYVISKNAFWNVKGLKDEGQNIKRVRVNGYRAYIMPPTAASDVPVGTAARMLSIEVPDSETTAIDDSNAIDDINAVFGGEATYYDTNGRRIPSLRQGVNIVKIGNRTKKVIIK